MKQPINRITRLDLDAMLDAVDRRDNALKVYQDVATKSAFYPGQGTALGLAYCALKLNGEAGELAEHVGKAMRDDELMLSIGFNGNSAPMFVAGELSPTRHALLIKEVGDVLWYVTALCNELGVTLDDVAETNVRKLFDRGERDALQGSGDER